MRLRIGLAHRDLRLDQLVRRIDLGVVLVLDRLDLGVALRGERTVVDDEPGGLVGVGFELGFGDFSCFDSCHGMFPFL